MPPRIVTVEGAELAGSVIPAYDVGGDWLDMCATPTRRVAGRRRRASARAPRPRRSARSASPPTAPRAGRARTLATAAVAIHEAIGSLGLEAIFLSAVLAEWHGDTGTLSWLRCGGPTPYVLERRRRAALAGRRRRRRARPPGHRAAGRGGLVPPGRGERVVLVSDGVLERIGPRDEQFGEDGLRAALATAPGGGAPELTAAVLDAVHCAGDQPLRDDATVLVVAPAD